MKNALIILFLMVTCGLSAQEMGLQDLGQLKESPAGSRIIQFMDLINGKATPGPEAARSLFSKRMVEKYGADDLAGMLEEVRQQDGQLSLYEPRRTEMFSYELKFKGHTSGEWLSASFKLENNPPYGIDGFGLEAGIGSLDSDAEPVYGPKEKMAFKSTPVETASTAIMAKKAEEIARAFHDMGWFDGVVLLAKDGQPYYHKAFGLADIENKKPNTLQTKFRIGSINKDYTALLILQQVQKGKLSLEDKLSKFDLGFPRNTADKITIRHLLQHSAGFSDIFIPEYLNNIRDYKDINDILPLLLNEPLIYEPGTNREYSNYGYIVLGAILEKTTGKSFGRLLQENIFEPAGLSDTHYDIAENIKGEAKSYRYTVTGEKIDHTGQLEYPTPDGGMYATAADLLKYLQTLFYTEKLLDDKHKALIASNFEPAERTWKDVLKNPRAEFGFAGGGPGVSAVVEMNLHDNHFMIILANTDGMVTEHISKRLRKAYNGKKYPAPEKPLANYIYQSYQQHGRDYLAANFKKIMKDGGFSDYDPSILNNAGYSLKKDGKLDEAIDLFWVNVQLFPKEANPYDSLAEAYLTRGDRANALKYYRKALEIDPNLPTAKKAVKKLETGN